MIWPLQNMSPAVPSSEGDFGAVRKHDYHTGIDLYCPTGTKVLAIEDGVLVHIDWNFTGPGGGSPWWNTTRALLIEGESGVIVYGEATPLVPLGSSVKAGDVIAVVDTSVLKKDKGKPMTMLHLELYEHGTRETVWWKLGEDRPKGLLNPWAILQF